MTDLEKFEEKRKESLFETIFSPLRRALEDLGSAMAGGGKAKAKNGKTTDPYQISPYLDKLENEKMKK